jgi:peptide/nickel transport system ATP-binding protein
MGQSDALMKVSGLRKFFPVRRGISALFSRRQLYVKAVDGVSFEIKPSEIYGLVGESGCGKTTTGRVVAGLVRPTEGIITFDGQDVSTALATNPKRYHKEVQIIFQDPYESLNPRMRVYDIISEPIRIHHLTETPDDERNLVETSLDDVGLAPFEQFRYRFPHELSGGQRQRVAIARALSLRPRFIVADEPVSMLDVSIRAGILNLLAGLVEKYKISLLFITHDLAVARHMCDRLSIMYLGKIVETGTPEQTVFTSLHPYTQALIAAVPNPDPTQRSARATIKGEVPTPINPPSGCHFHPRCPQYIGNICQEVEPPLVDQGEGHRVACHLYPRKHTEPIPECCGAMPRISVVAKSY